MALAVTVPLSSAVTSPAELIVALPVPFIIDHVTVFTVASDGVIEYVSCAVPPGAEINVGPMIVILVTGIV